jgi:hypothetical protein
MELAEQVACHKGRIDFHEKKCWQDRYATNIFENIYYISPFDD